MALIAQVTSLKLLVHQKPVLISFIAPLSLLPSEDGAINLQRNLVPGIFQIIVTHSLLFGKPRLHVLDWFHPLPSSACPSLSGECCCGLYESSCSSCSRLMSSCLPSLPQ